MGLTEKLEAAQAAIDKYMASRRSDEVVARALTALSAIIGAPDFSPRIQADKSEPTAEKGA